jgi:hypothetical protein
MGVYTFVCRNSGGEWTAKQHSGEIEASAATTYELQRQLVAAASAADSASGVQSSFSMVTPSSAVFQVWSYYAALPNLRIRLDANYLVVKDLNLLGSLNRCFSRIR